MIRFAREARSDVTRRTIDELLRVSDSQFEASAKERDLRLLGRVMETLRDVSENISVFRTRSVGILTQIDHQSLLPPDLLFLRGFKALNLPRLQRTSLLTFLECRGLVHSMSNLKTSPIRLSARYQGLYTSAEPDPNTYFAEHGSSNCSQSSVEEEEDDIYATRRKGVEKPVAGPGVKSPRSERPPTIQMCRTRYSP